MRRRKARAGDSIDHFQRGEDARPGIRKVEHDAIPQPFHRATTVLHRRPLHESVEGFGKVGRCLVSTLLGQARVAGDVEEADGGVPLGRAMDTRRVEQVAETADDVRRPGQRLLGMPRREQGVPRVEIQLG
jgi:hypothetical protein